VKGPERLAGNGACLVRERALAARVQSALERLYEIDRVVDIEDFVHEAPVGEREALLLREAPDGDLEVSVQLPPLEGERGLDTLCQLIEGVSHFVYLAHRVQTSRETTHLELELQAEVDKWVVLAASIHSLDVTHSERLRACLYEDVTFAHDPRSELGERYRVANGAANRFVRRLERNYVGLGRFSDLRGQLRHFFQLGLEAKLRLGRDI